MTRRPADTPSDAGWWEVEVAEAGPGTDYAFRLDDGPPRPDPRSPSQPRGVFGPSRLVDHHAFAWHDRSWAGLDLRSAVLYELHVGTFTPAGSFDGVIGRLDHIVALGVDAVQLLPVAEFSGDRGWGYDGVDLFAPHHGYGGPDGLKRLVDACHGRGLGVIVDVVYNHLGPAGNYLADFGPYFSQTHHTNWGAAVNFDGPGSAAVRTFVLDNAIMWLRDYHCDGLRLDAVHAIVDDSALHIVEELTAVVHDLAAELGRALAVIAESDRNDPRLVRSVDIGGFGVDAVWADEFHHALHAVLTGERDGYYRDFGTLAQLATALRQAWVYAGDYSPYRRRVHGRRPSGIGGERFVVFLQNHDQVGNRATGNRIGQTNGVTCGRVKIGAALTLLGPFVPLLFQGEEWAASAPFLYFTDHDDPGLGRAVTEGRRQEFRAFGWAASEIPDPQDPTTFARSRLDWDEVSLPVHQSMLEWYRMMIELRRQVRGLDDGRREDVEVAFDEAERWLAMSRPSVTVAANLGAAVAAVPMAALSGARVQPATSDAGRMEIVAASHTEIAWSDAALLLPPDSVAVLRAGRFEPAGAPRMFPPDR